MTTIVAVKGAFTSPFIPLEKGELVVSSIANGIYVIAVSPEKKKIVLSIAHGTYSSHHRLIPPWKRGPGGYKNI